MDLCEIGGGEGDGGMVCVGMASVMVGVAFEDERKLLQTPAGVGSLAAAARAFEDERGCPVREVLVAREQFIPVLRLVGLAALESVRVRVEEQVREGHVVFVGLPAREGDSPLG